MSVLSVFQLLTFGLSNSSANPWFYIISILTATPEVFLSKNS